LCRVGKPGEKGVVEISDLMFTTKGSTAGAILMEWNVHEDEQGSAAMWDVIFRVGGALGTELTMKECHWTRKFTSPKGKYQGPADKCMAATLMLHVTEKSSIYLENTWLWVAGKCQFSRGHFVALMRLSTTISRARSKHELMSMVLEAL
jgi:hypothetical protein